MWASSSTTRTLKLKPAIPSIHHHPVIRMSGRRERNVNELALHLPTFRLDPRALSAEVAEAPCGDPLVAARLSVPARRTSFNGLPWRLNRSRIAFSRQRRYEKWSKP